MRLDDENASFRFNQKGLRKFMGDLEVDIMEIVWKKANPTVTVRDIYDVLRNQREIAYTTVMTTMVRLAEKGILRIVDKAGLANCYTPALNRADFIQSAVSKVLDIFFDQFPQEANQFMVERMSRPAKKASGGKRK